MKIPLWKFPRCSVVPKRRFASDSISDSGLVLEIGIRQAALGETHSQAALGNDGTGMGRDYLAVGLGFRAASTTSCCCCLWMSE